MKAYRSFKKRGSPDCPISIARYEHNMYLPPKPHYHPEVEIAYIQQGHILCTLDEIFSFLPRNRLICISPLPWMPRSVFLFSLWML